MISYGTHPWYIDHCALVPARCTHPGLLLQRLRGRKEIMSEPPESVNAIMPVEETGYGAVLLTPPASPMQPRNFFERLFSRRRSAGGFVFL